MNEKKRNPSLQAGAMAGLAVVFSIIGGGEIAMHQEAFGLMFCGMGTLMALTAYHCRGRELRGAPLFAYAWRHHRELCWLALVLVPTFAFLAGWGASRLEWGPHSSLASVSYGAMVTLLGLNALTSIVMIRSVEEAAAPPEPARF